LTKVSTSFAVNGNHTYTTYLPPSISSCASAILYSLSEYVQIFAVDALSAVTASGAVSLNHNHVAVCHLSTPSAGSGILKSTFVKLIVLLVLSIVAV
jgi:hypothetical protein